MLPRLLAGHPADRQHLQGAETASPRLDMVEADLKRDGERVICGDWRHRSGRAAGSPLARSGAQAFGAGSVHRSESVVVDALTAVTAFGSTELLRGLHTSTGWPTHTPRMTRPGTDAPAPIAGHGEPSPQPDCRHGSGRSARFGGAARESRTRTALCLCSRRKPGDRTSVTRIQDGRRRAKSCSSVEGARPGETTPSL